jgi:carbon-monoxide dehydrogenase small subunit
VAQQREIAVTVNGQQYAATVEVRQSLVDFIREGCGLTGTHVGCEHGVCGACTVLLDGEGVRSCIVLAVQADGADIVTVEGLAQDERLHPLQEAFWQHHGLQCGYCTPGMLISALELLRDHSDPDETTIREGLGGNLCICTGYVNIVRAVQTAATTMRGTRPEDQASGERVLAGPPATTPPDSQPPNAQPLPMIETTYDQGE